MTPPLLVAYATKHESTHDVAEAIATRLRVDGWTVEVRRAGEVNELDRYAGVVLGTALYTGRVHRDARGFLRCHHDALAARPVAVFAMGPRTTAPDDVAASRAQLDKALAHAPAPDAVAVFGGVVDPSKLHFPFNRMEPCDARDWPAIDAWAEQVSAIFAKAPAVTPSP
ncbi:MAG TPA: flavodoxin domain-containing protein [Conexibacter sp.]|nr:flavodoxin domain-containing protein [Conexibacter sp.]